jgi:uncharacterized protein
MVMIALKVTPRASSNAVAGILGNEVRVKVTAPPVDSAANAAVVDFLAEKLGCPRGAVRLVRGATNPHKTVSVAGLKMAEVARRLGLA